jgi:hypothetical protein
MATTFVPGLASLACVFFLGTGNALALTLFNVSMVSGLINAIWPALQNLDETEATVLASSAPEPVTQDEQAPAVQ